LISVTARVDASNGTGSCYVGFAISGDTTRAATDNNALILEGSFLQAASATYVVTGLPAGGTITLTVEYKSPPSLTKTCDFDNRSIWALPLG
jgi:hypothetical protein